MKYSVIKNQSKIKNNVFYYLTKIEYIISKFRYKNYVVMEHGNNHVILGLGILSYPW